ncbi:MAG: Gfo/Idh/MocA family oxidoreductase [Pirellulaceae bacterium]|nr:Gfo/Idh/MocA family oxidoreductase [Pirellulaceae bacterium]
MVRVGIAGVGFMGWIHYLAYQQVADVELAAICTRDAKKRAGDWRGIKGNFGPEGTQVDLSGLAAYARLEDLLADPSIDCVDICLPPALHAEATIAALRAGKHVFCEKPMALTTDECDRMLEAAQQAGKLLLIGHVLPLFPEYAAAHQLIQSGQYGKLLGGTFKRVISDPLWLADFYDPQRVGGPLIDLHVHDAHLIRLLFGMPWAVSSVGRMRGEVVEYCNSLFHYMDPELVVSASSGVINQQGRSFTHGFELHLERATLHYEFAVIGDKPELLMPLTILDDQGQVTRPELGNGDPVRAFEAEVRAVAASIASGQPSPVLDGQLARDAILLCHRQTEAVRTGRATRI